MGVKPVVGGVFGGLERTRPLGPWLSSPGSPCSWQPIMKFINDQYEKYLQEEVNINRKKRIPDTRVHCCLYFIPATGHSYVPFGALGLGGGSPRV